MVFYCLLNIIIVLVLAFRILILDGSKLEKGIVLVFSGTMIYFFADEIIKNLNM
ncbi:hypothetical protein [Clostridium perfringens]|uniref:hypothetical protein n=1 Tax=Clostridium perfringens TaxID=1502 RepID=UPI003F420D82